MEEITVCGISLVVSENFGGFQIIMITREGGWRCEGINCGKDAKVCSLSMYYVDSINQRLKHKQINTKMMRSYFPFWM
jgi:hypothetical protein